MGDQRCACEKCRYWVQTKEMVSSRGRDVGQCRARPPVPVLDQEKREVLTQIPVTHRTFWCGEFQLPYQEEYDYAEDDYNFDCQRERVL